MAPNKFEKHIKNQLEEREIRPSATAWESLSERLDAETPRAKKRDYFLYGIAASVIGLLIISILYFNTSDTVNATDVQIVDTNEEAIENKISSEIETRDVQEAVVQSQPSKEQSSSAIKSRNEHSISMVKNQVASVEKMDVRIESVLEKVATVEISKEEVIHTKILEIVAAVDSLEQNNGALTNVEVDNLLRNAQEEILRDKLFNENGSVDAMALLTEVEDELDQSFRDQIFESLKTGFLKVRTAVADRNK